MTLESALRIVKACVEGGFDFETIYVSRKWVRQVYETIKDGKPRARFPHWDWKMETGNVLQRRAEAWYIPRVYFEKWRINERPLD